MTPTEADRLAKRIINTWQGAPPLPEWADTLEPLDAGTAGTAYIRLRNDSDATPTIARYMAVYRSLDTKRPDSAPHRGCTACGRQDGPYPSNGDGWNTVEYERNGRTYRGAIPCNCPLGRTRDAVYASIRKEVT